MSLKGVFSKGKEEERKSADLSEWQSVQAALGTLYGDRGCGYLSVIFSDPEETPDTSKEKAWQNIQNFKNKMGLVTSLNVDGVDAFLKEVSEKIKLIMSIPEFVDKWMVLRVLDKMETDGWGDCLTCSCIACGAGIPEAICQEFLDELKEKGFVFSEENERREKVYFIQCRLGC